MFDFSRFDNEFNGAVKIADRFHEIVKSIPPAEYTFAEDRRHQGSNPYHNRTSRGLCIELYYDMPNKVWTPWGYYGYGGSGGGVV